MRAGKLLGALSGAILVTAATVATAQERLAGPVRVLDGDTIVVGGRTLDLAGIDAPELGQRCRRPAKTFDCGHIAKTALMDLTAGATAVCLLGDRGARCWVDGFDLAENMVHTGWALADGAAPARFRAVQQKARAAERGLWRHEFVAPARWRAGDRLIPKALDIR